MPREKTTLKTAVGAVVDESDSMTHRATETRSAFNEYFDNIQKDDPTATVTAVTFSQFPGDENVRFLCKNESVVDMPYLDTENYAPRGVTPLLDAVGQTIEVLSKQKADRYLVVILTDGAENASREYSRERIQQIISEKEKTDRWTFVFVGAGIDAWSGAQGLGISTRGTTFSYSGAPGTTQQTTKRMSNSTSVYLGSVETVSPDFFEDGTAKKVKSKT